MVSSCYVITPRFFSSSAICVPAPKKIKTCIGQTHTVAQFWRLNRCSQSFQLVKPLLWLKHSYPVNYITKNSLTSCSKQRYVVQTAAARGRCQSIYTRPHSPEKWSNQAQVKTPVWGNPCCTTTINDSKLQDWNCIFQLYYRVKNGQHCQKSTSSTCQQSDRSHLTWATRSIFCMQVFDFHIAQSLLSLLCFWFYTLLIFYPLALYRVPKSLTAKWNMLPFLFLLEGLGDFNKGYPEFC